MGARPSRVMPLPSPPATLAEGVPTGRAVLALITEEAAMTEAAIADHGMIGDLKLALVDAAITLDEALDGQPADHAPSTWDEA